MGRRKDARHWLPAHVHTVRSKEREYHYYQLHRGRPGQAPRVKIPGTPFGQDGTPESEWWDAYRRFSGTSAGEKAAGTFAALIADYKASPEWRDLSPTTVKEWTRYLSYVDDKWGSLRVARVEPRHVLALRDKFADKPVKETDETESGGKKGGGGELRRAAANNLVGALSAMMTWSVPRGWATQNPCLAVKKLKGGPGYEPWSWEAITLFRKVARKKLWQAAALALYSGQRQGDVLRMRWEDIREGQIRVEQGKTGKKLWIPMHAELKRIIAGIRKEAEFILTSDRGTEWTVDGFKTAWQRQMGEERLEGLRRERLVFHGLRKSSVVMLLEAGCTDAEVAAITGQSREMVEHYARQVNQRKLAAAAILKWEAVRKVRRKKAA
jgi:integrase